MSDVGIKNTGGVKNIIFLCFLKRNCSTSNRFSLSMQPKTAKTEQKKSENKKNIKTMRL